MAGPRVQQVSTDTLAPYVTNGSSMQHATELETDTFAWGSTVVSAFQVGRNSRGYGSQAIGWATSTDNGVTWTHGILPHLTASSPSPNRTYPVVVNQSVAYDARHGRWLIPSVVYLPSGTGAFHEKALLVNRSSDGKSWGTSATTAVSTNVDKAWGVCDNTSSSPHFGTCYVAYSQIDSSDALAVVHTTNGGLSWSAPVQVHATGGTRRPGTTPTRWCNPLGTSCSWRPMTERRRRLGAHVHRVQGRRSDLVTTRLAGDDPLPQSTGWDPGQEQAVGGCGSRRKGVRRLERLPIPRRLCGR